MSRYLFAIRTTADRDRVLRYVTAAPFGTRVEFKAAKRTLEQNSKLWASLSEIADQLPWHGTKLTADSWKLLFMDALKRELRVVPNLDGTGFVSLNTSSSDLTKSEMSDMIELIAEFGARHGVKFSDQEEAA